MLQSSVFLVPVYFNAFLQFFSSIDIRMGGSDSKEEKLPPPRESVKADEVEPVDIKRLGLENYGNTCYCNGVIQILYYCLPLRRRLLQLYDEHFSSSIPDGDYGVLARLCELFHLFRSSKKKKGSLGPSVFVQKVKKENECFNNREQQDAHEFAIFVINQLAEGERKLLSLPSDQKGPIQELFVGQLIAESICMECDTRAISYEPCVGLSLEVEQNVSLMHCIKSFSSPEYLRGDDKFQCDACCSPVLARRSLRLQELPRILLIHFKRFKFVEQQHAYKKLPFRIPFPLELAVPYSEMSIDHRQLQEKTAMFRLVGFVVHMGAGINLGHYFACILSDDRWYKFDDEVVSPLTDREAQLYFGYSVPVENQVTSTAYILLYTRE